MSKKAKKNKDRYEDINLSTFEEKINDCNINFWALSISYDFCDQHALSDDYRKIVFEAFLHNGDLHVKDLVSYFINYSDYFCDDFKSYLIMNGLVDEFINNLDGKIVKDKDGYMTIGKYNKKDFYKDLSKDHQLGVVI